MCGKTYEKVDKTYNFLHMLLKELGFEINDKKSVSPPPANHNLIDLKFYPFDVVSRYRDTQTFASRDV